MNTAKVGRSLSGFSPDFQKWLPVRPPISLRDPRARKISLISWNIDAFSSRPVSRAKLILNHVLAQSPDVVFLQEVSLEVRASLLNDAKIRSSFMVTDAEDQTSFENVPFATMTFLSNLRFSEFSSTSQSQNQEEPGLRVGAQAPFRLILPSKYRRDGLCVDIVQPCTSGSVIRLINVHLDSLGDTLHYRNQQLKILASTLHDPGCTGGLIAGDFNAITPGDHDFIGRNGLIDVWATLHDERAAEGFTWGVGLRHKGRLGPGRLDKVAASGLKVENMEVLPCGSMDLPQPGEKYVEVPWSDHCGIKCLFEI